MQISLGFLKRLLLSVVFITSNTTFASNTSTSSSSDGAGQTYRYDAGEGYEDLAPSPSSAPSPTPVAQAPAGPGEGASNNNSPSAPGMGDPSALSQLGSARAPAEDVTKTDLSKVDCSKVDTSAKDDNASKVHCDNVKEIETAVTAVPATSINRNAIVAAHNTFQQKWKSCNGSHSAAAKVCLENLSTNISDSLSKVGLMVGAMSGANSANGSCDTAGKIMDIANAALTAYNAACSAAKSYCAVGCNGVIKALEEMSKANQSNTCPQNDIACGQALPNSKTQLTAAIEKETKNKSDTMSMAGKKELCTGKYVQLLASAAVGVGSILMSMGQSEKCEKETEAASIDCSKPQYAKTPTCLCQANPRMQGCSNSLQKSGESASAANFGGRGASINESDSANPTLSGGSGLDIEREPSSASSAGLPGGGGGGAGSALGGNGLSGSGGSGSGSGGGRGSGLDTNILGGGASGGGGGGWGRAGFGGSNNGNSKLGAYLPGGEKDPKMNGNSWANEVTGQGGKSNWEKVRERYRENKTSLFNN